MQDLINSRNTILQGSGFNDWFQHFIISLRPLCLFAFSCYSTAFTFCSNDCARVWFKLSRRNHSNISSFQNTLSISSRFHAIPCFGHLSQLRHCTGPVSMTHLSRRSSSNISSFQHNLSISSRFHAIPCFGHVSQLRHCTGLVSMTHLSRRNNSNISSYQYNLSISSRSHAIPCFGHLSQ